MAAIKADRGPPGQQKNWALCAKHDSYQSQFIPCKDTLRMIPDTLTLTAFRSYTAQTLAFTDPFVVITGENGAGKTNILEALSLLAPGRGLRGAKLAEFQKMGEAAPWAISLRLQNGVQLGTGRDPGSEDSARRVAVVEGQRTTPAAFLDHLAVSWITPAMDRLWTESPSGRRRFLDRLTGALEPAHGTHLNRYEEALAERNRLLREGCRDDGWLAGLEHVLATEGIAVAAARREVVRALEVLLRDARRGVFPTPLLHLEGVEAWLDTTPALLAEDRLRAELARSRPLDAAAGSTSLGPHRTDLQAWHPDKQIPAGLCSTGEQKALVISLILAHADLIRQRHARPPVLLLDEVGAHLDETRRMALFAALEERAAPVFLTGADPALFTKLSGRVQRYHVVTEPFQAVRLVDAA